MTDTLPPTYPEHEVSQWVARFASLVPPGGKVLDVACGTGRHARFFAAQGHPVNAVDRDITRVAHASASIRLMEADLEAGSWPFVGATFAGVVVTNYLYRGIMAPLIDCVAPGGVLIYETFAMGNEQFGRPRRADFLLRPGELLEAVRGHLHVVAFEDLYTDLPRPARVQRIAAVRPKV
ncbi:MAG: methyltransferase domain-containing protein [Usitatibacteraceae bacterium]